MIYPRADDPSGAKKFGQWVRLNLMPPEPTASPGISPSEDPTEMQPQNAPSDPKVQPLLNPSLSSNEESLNNQTLTTSDPGPGAYQPSSSEQPTWTDIKLENLHDDTRSEKLRQEAIQRGYVRDTPSDRVNFFAAIARPTGLQDKCLWAPSDCRGTGSLARHQPGG
jgi:hypothetical protein